VRTAAVVLSGIDPMLREVATGALVCDLPDCVVLRYDLDQLRRGLRRVLSTASGVLETGRRGLGACATCAVRDDALATVSALAARALLACETRIDSSPYQSDR